MAMYKHLLTGVVLAALGACVSAPTGTSVNSRADLPPLGLAATAVWLERREALTRASQVRANEIRAAQVNGLPPKSAPRQVVQPAPAPSAPAAQPKVNVDGFANRLLFAKSAAEIQVLVFVEACLKTSANPNAAPTVLKRLGFKERRGRRGTTEYSTDYARVIVSKDTRSDGLGQCVVVPSSDLFAEAVPEFSKQIEASGVPVRKIPNEIAYVVGDTAAVALISRPSGRMTRTQTGVFRQR